MYENIEPKLRKIICTHVELIILQLRMISNWGTSEDKTRARAILVTLGDANEGYYYYKEEEYEWYTGACQVAKSASDKHLDELRARVESRET